MIAEEYCDRIIGQSNVWKNTDERAKVIEKLIRGYPCHGYVIDCKELKELGFPVRLPNKDEKIIINKIAGQLVRLEEPELFITTDNQPRKYCCPEAKD